MKQLFRRDMPVLLASALLALTQWGCTAVSEEGFFPTDQGRLYIDDLPVSAVSAASGVTETVMVVSNVTWTATVDQTWVTVAATGDESGAAGQRLEGQGQQELTLTFQGNTTATERKVTLTITPDDIAEGVKAVTTVITQNSPNFAVTPLDITGVEPNDPEKQTITIVANNEWNIETQSNWITATPNRGVASEGEEILVELTFENNYTNTERTGQIVVHCGDQAATVSVHQLRGDFTVSRNAIEFSAIGGTQTIDIASIRPWTSNINGYSWIEVSPSMGENNTTGIAINVLPNNEPTPRDGVINFNCGDINIPVAIYQNAGGLRLSEQVFNLDAGQHSIEVSVSCLGQWSVMDESGASWCELLNNGGQGDGTIALEIAENDTENDRVATYNVRFGAFDQKIRVSQSRASSPIVSFTDVIGTEKYTVAVSASVETTLHIIESGFIYVEGEDLDPITATLRRTVPCGLQGNLMETTIGELDSAVTYVIRAYVKTDHYEVYGDASRFTTAGLIPEEDHPTPSTK